MKQTHYSPTIQHTLYHRISNFDSLFRWNAKIGIYFLEIKNHYSIIKGSETLV